LLLAALHYNENSNRCHAITADGDKRYKVVYPKFKQGGYSVRPIQVDPTFSKYPESNIFLEKN
jgi:solute carrier family 8 (sodium/calcium exchanger)